MEEKGKSEIDIKKEYLHSYIPKVRSAKIIEEEIERLRMSKMFPSLVCDDMPHGTDKRDLSDYMVKLEELEQKLIKARYELIDLYSKIFSDIEKVEDDNERNVLIYRYLRGYSWERICVKMNYQWAQVHRIHARALQHFKFQYDVVNTSKSVREYQAV